ncbi:hypothetical protein HY439_02765 [Candidatus Microgenomates bacterium]|nr:hypothetical protein [Candidatus Microgenomates bacterium]
MILGGPNPDSIGAKAVRDYGFDALRIFQYSTMAAFYIDCLVSGLEGNGAMEVRQTKTKKLVYRYFSCQYSRDFGNNLSLLFCQKS